MEFSHRLDVGYFSYFAKELQEHQGRPLGAFWCGRLAKNWSMTDLPVSYEEFVCMTLYRRPGHLVSPEAIAQTRKTGTDKMTSMSAGWLIEEAHPPVVAQNIARDRRLVEAVREAITAALAAMEQNIHAFVPGKNKPVHTGRGAYAVTIYGDKVLAFLFDVTVLNDTDARSYAIDEATALGRQTMGVALPQ